MVDIGGVVLVDIMSTDSLTPVKWFFDSSQTMRWLKSKNGLYDIQHRFPNESHRVSSVLRFEELCLEFEQSWSFLIENPENILSFQRIFVTLHPTNITNKLFELKRNMETTKKKRTREEVRAAVRETIRRKKEWIEKTNKEFEMIRNGELKLKYS